MGEADETEGWVQPAKDYEPSETKEAYSEVDEVPAAYLPVDHSALINEITQKSRTLFISVALVSSFIAVILVIGFLLISREVGGPVLVPGGERVIEKTAPPITITQTVQAPPVTITQEVQPQSPATPEEPNGTPSRTPDSTSETPSRDETTTPSVPAAPTGTTTQQSIPPANIFPFP